MSYRIEPGESLAEAAKRIAHEQTSRALAALDEPADDTLDARIHDARKRFKKVRAVARLVRDDVGEDVYKAINVAYRDAGRLLSDVRDAAVHVETIDVLTEVYASVVDEGALDGLRQQLAERHQAIRGRLEARGARAEATELVRSLEPAIDDWPISEGGFEVVSEGLRRVYKRGRKGWQRSLDDPKTEHLHDWRKRVKYLWYHVRILAPTWPKVLEPLADELHELANDLGDDHDLAELEQTLRNEEDLGDPTERDAVMGLMTERRAELQERAFERAERLYAEPPGAFVGRMGEYVEAWEAGEGRAATG